jgi:biotin/methionine sulfoxide reductase
MRLSVVKISTGAWLDLQEDAEGALCKHGNPNVLTRDAGTSRLAQGSSAQSCVVQVERWQGVVPPVTAFDRPTFVASDARATAPGAEKGGVDG